MCIYTYIYINFKLYDYIYRCDQNYKPAQEVLKNQPPHGLVSEEWAHALNLFQQSAGQNVVTYSAAISALEKDPKGGCHGNTWDNDTI